MFRRLFLLTISFLFIGNFSLLYALVPATTEEVLADIYAQLTESDNVDYEELAELLFSIAAEPIDINSADREQLAALRFLSEQQIDHILLYIWQHPLDTITELQLIPTLHDYDVRNLLPFVRVVRQSQTETRLRIREVFADARHELTLRTDVRYCEAFTADPFYANMRYRFNYRQRVQASVTFRRPTGAPPKDFQYGGSLRINDIGPVRRLVIGGIQASFGQGLALSPVFHLGKIAYVRNTALSDEGIRSYNTPDGAGLYGAGATFRLHRYVELTALYGAQQANDSVWRHVVGANLTLRYRRMKIGVTAAENLWSDSLKLRNAAYNQHYFRGHRQAIIALNARYNRGWLDLFGEVAAAQNSTWGWATVLGSRITPVQDVGLTLLCRYYSPWFDNTLGYAFSETSRINDERGIYLGADITRLPYWRFTTYADFYYFSGKKYGIPDAPSWGYDVVGEAAWLPDAPWEMSWRLRARQKGGTTTGTARYQCTWSNGLWRFQTRVEANLYTADSFPTYGFAMMQDIRYAFRGVPLTLQGRLALFDTRSWDNRIYAYENDVLYAMSTPALYGVGARAYLNLRWKILPQLTLYCRFSETLYTRFWAAQRDIPITRTDIHLLLRATF